MAETLRLVKRQFGRDAVILSTRTLTKGAILGLGGRPCVEITAAAGIPDLPAPLKRGTVNMRSGGCARAEGAATPMSSPPETTSAQTSEVILSEVGAIRTLVDELVRETRRSPTPNLPEELYSTYQKLVENAVAGEIARTLVEELRRKLSAEELREPHSMRAQLAELMEPMLPMAGPIRLTNTEAPTIVALIGPTGVGKTTTIAKLAANLCLREQRKAGLITIDTYRIAAVDQLRTYAQIIDVPLEVVTTPKELQDAVARMADQEVILIDTAGRSQRDTCRIKELAEFFDAVRPDEVHLVLSGTCTEAVLLETIQRFHPVGVNRVIFTKLDETIGFGVILSCLEKAEAQLSYVTTGQGVPDDIQVGEGKALAHLILGRQWQQAHDAAPARQDCMARLENRAP